MRVELRAHLRPMQNPPPPDWWRCCEPCVTATVIIDGVEHSGWSRYPDTRFDSLEQATDYTQPVWRALVEEAVGALGSLPITERSELLSGGMGLEVLR